MNIIKQFSNIHKKYKTMKKLILLIVIINFTTVLQAQQNTFSKVLTDVPEYGIQAYSVVPTFDNAYMIVGDVDYEQQGLIIKVNLDGNVLWNKTFYNTNPYQYRDMIFHEIISTNDSCFVLVGSAYNESSNHLDALCIKINSDGDTLWSKTISQTDFSIRALSVQQANDSGYIMTGYANNLSASCQKIFVAKLNLSGNLQWTNLLEESNLKNKGYSVKQTPDSCYVVTGFLENYPPFDPNAFLLKLTPTGEFLWAKKYHLSTNEICFGHDIEITNDGFLFYLELGNHIALMKTDFSGNILWNKSYNQYTSFSYEYYSTKFHKTSDSCYVFVSAGEWGSGLSKVDSDGNMIWTKDVFLKATDVVETINKEFFVIGNGPMYGVKDLKFESPQIGIIQTDSLGNEEDCVSSMNVQPKIDTIISSSATFTSLAGGIENTIHPIINSLVLESDTGCIDFLGSINETLFEKEILVFPNPSNGIFTVNINNEKAAQIIIYNTMGEKIYQSKLYNQEFEIDLSSKPKGMYFYKLLFTDNEIVTGKLIIAP